MLVPLGLAVTLHLLTGTTAGASFFSVGQRLVSTEGKETRDGFTEGFGGSAETRSTLELTLLMLGLARIGPARGFGAIDGRAFGREGTTGFVSTSAGAFGDLVSLDKELAGLTAEALGLLVIVEGKESLVVAD